MLKLFVATQETQGQRTNDFCYVPENEIVNMPAFECDGEAIDGRCGCKRSMTGISSSTATTTCKVVELDLTHKGLRHMLWESYQKGGWTKLMDEQEMQHILEGDIETLLHAAAPFPVGTIVERRGNTLRERRTEAQQTQRKVDVEQVKAYMFRGLALNKYRTDDGTLNAKAMAKDAAKQFNLPTTKDAPIFKLADHIAEQWVRVAALQKEQKPCS